jgi:NAD(P)-dependent dehydrogenase (short-subunit alcohol dehydrogenase family)
LGGWICKFVFSFLCRSPSSRSELYSCGVRSRGYITVEWLILVRFVNNAGIAIEGENPSKEDPFHVGVHATPISTWDKTQRINARGTFLGCKYAITQMLKQEVGPSGSRGWIINMASVAGLVGIAGARMSYFANF